MKRGESMGEQKQVKPTISIGIMAVCSIGMALGSIMPALAKIYSSYPDVPVTSIGWIVSISQIVQIISGLLIGTVAGRFVKLKTLAIICTVLFILGGSAPAFIPGF
ncbi:MAG: hypothetical protein LBS79_09095 [Tannerella sp.]|jgi:MFS family permease|nr:hypothetical protein [Tannerella sp.]